MMSGTGNRRYLDPGDRLSGRQDPPRPCQVLIMWGPGGGPRNVLAEYSDGTRAVIPFPRRLRRAPVIPPESPRPGAVHGTGADLLGDRPATAVTRQIASLAFDAGLNPHLDPSGVRRGSYQILVDSGGRRDCLSGRINVGARTGRILHAHLTHGRWGQEQRYSSVAELRAILTSWAALQRDSGNRP